MVQSKLLCKFKDVKHYFFDKTDSLAPERYRVKIASCVFAQQVHSSRVVLVNRRKNTLINNCDGLVTKKNLFLGLRTADCLPIFFYHPKKMIIAAIHAGWRGLYLGILANSVKKMQELGSNPKELIVAIGPSIKACCYNVSWERMQKFQKEKSPLFPTIGKFRQSKWYLDLEKIAILQMVDLGVLVRNIEALPFCTFCDKRFNSVRRDGYLTKRMLSVIGLT